MHFNYILTSKIGLQKYSIVEYANEIQRENYLDNATIILQK